MQMVIKELIKGFPYRGGIHAVVGIEPPAPNQRINLGLAYFERDAPKSLSAAIPVPSHAQCSGRSNSCGLLAHKLIFCDRPTAGVLSSALGISACSTLAIVTTLQRIGVIGFEIDYIR